MFCGQHYLGKPEMFEDRDNNIIELKHCKRTQSNPLVIYTDFECSLKKCSMSTI